MDHDLTAMLAEWPFQPGQINVRLIQGQDGEPRIQVRLDLGLLQMHVDGRPDGDRPQGFDSLLEYHESKLDELRGLSQPPTGENEEELSGAGTSGLPGESDEEDSGEGPKILSPEDCRLLREEAIQYYHRYIALLVLDDFDGVARDTSRNLRVLDLIAEHAETEEDRRSMEQNRPYVMMMRARALASMALRDEEPKAAAHAIEEGIEALRQYFDDNDAPEAFEKSSEVEMLKEMREALVPKLPLSQRAELRQRLEGAITAENYELAAILRDELRMINDKPNPSGPTGGTASGPAS
ncbi:MAG: UvrB/UvrC motif-containing protein [Phycisphaerales bacterium]